MTLPYPQCEGKDEDTDVVEEDDGHEGVHVALHVAGGGELLGDIVFPVNVRMHKTLHDPIEQATEDDAYREAHTDVAQIVNTEVETGEGGGERPEDEGGCHFGTAEEPREKDGNAHGVAGMAREEAEASASVVAHHINEIHELRVLRGTPAFHHRFDQAWADAVCHENEQGYGDIDHHGFSPSVVLEDDDEQGDDDQRPWEGVGDGVHQVVPEEAVATVDGKRELMVKFVELVHYESWQLTVES